MVMIFDSLKQNKEIFCLISSDDGISPVIWASSYLMSTFEV